MPTRALTSKHSKQTSTRCGRRHVTSTTRRVATGAAARVTAVSQPAAGRPELSPVAAAVSTRPRQEWPAPAGSVSQSESRQRPPPPPAESAYCGQGRGSDRLARPPPSVPRLTISAGWLPHRPAGSHANSEQSAAAAALRAGRTASGSRPPSRSPETRRLRVSPECTPDQAELFSVHSGSHLTRRSPAAAAAEPLTKVKTVARP